MWWVSNLWLVGSSHLMGRASLGIIMYVVNVAKYTPYAWIMHNSMEAEVDVSKDQDKVHILQSNLFWHYSLIILD